MNHRLREAQALSDRPDDDAAVLLEARFARRIAARLNEQAAAATPHDVTERLRFARSMALERARAQRSALQPAGRSVPLTMPSPERAAALAGGSGSGRQVLGPREPSAWWVRLATALPLAALVGGLLLIQHQHVNEQIAAAAEIDADLLTDSVPPAAYNDPGFLEFLKSPQN